MIGGGALNVPSWDTAADVWRLHAGRLSPAEPMRRTRTGCGAVKRSPLCPVIRTREPAGIDGQGFDLTE